MKIMSNNICQNDTLCNFSGDIQAQASYRNQLLDPHLSCLLIQKITLLPVCLRRHFLSFPNLPVYNCLSPTLRKGHFRQPSFSTLPSSRVSKPPQCQKLLECHCKDLESKWLMTNKLFGRWDGFQVLLSTKVKELQLSCQLTDPLNDFWR